MHMRANIHSYLEKVWNDKHQTANKSMQIMSWE